MNQEMKPVSASSSIRTSCGHAANHAIRIRLATGWATVCVECWRSKRKSYRSREDRSLSRTYGTGSGSATADKRPAPAALHSPARSAQAPDASRCLVTGAAGFIGSHLGERLLAEGYEVVGVDCLTDYYSSDLKRQNLEGLLRHPLFRFVEEDLNETDLPSLLEGVDWVFHLAGQPGVRGSWGSGFSPYVRNNIEATQRLVEAVRTSTVKKLVIASSSSVYGNMAPPMTEDSPTQPYSPYGVTKLTAENLCMSYARNFNLPIAAVRYFTVFGPRQRPDMAFTRFLKALREGRELSVFGDGRQTRDFTYVSDAVEGTLLAAKNGAPGEVYNLGGGCPTTLIDTIRAMERATGRTARVKYATAQSGDVTDTLADASKARRELGYSPSVSFEEGMKLQARWVEQQEGSHAATVKIASPVQEDAPQGVWLREIARLLCERPRVLLYSHDTFGLGHLRRNLAIADHLLRRNPPFSVKLLTGSPVLRSWPLPEGLEVQALPAVVKVGAEQYVSRDGAESFATVKARRERLILEVIRSYRPDIFLVDHAPAGMKGELLEALAYLRQEMPETHTVIGLRDILDSPQAVQELWEAQGIYRLLEQSYDQVLVYGSRHLFDCGREYNFPESVARKTQFCGYIARSIGGLPAYDGDHSRKRHDKPLVLVTAGGGGDGYPLMEGYLGALEEIAPGAVRSILVPGPLMAKEQREALERAAAKRPDVKLLHTTELEAFIWRADLVVSMSGYNTTAEILAARKPSILVPRAAPRAEQRMRATLLVKLGLARVVQPEEDVALRLAEHLKAALADNFPARRNWHAVDLGGVHRVGEALADLLTSSAREEQPAEDLTALATAVGV